jgi:SnoaL-like domain
MGDRDGEPFDVVATRLARRIAELANTADVDVFAAGVRMVFSADYVLHPRTDPEVVGVEAYIERLLGARSGLPPDWTYDFVIDDLVVGTDRFAMRYHWTLTSEDGRLGNAALEINRVADGQVVETWNYQNPAGVSDPQLWEERLSGGA